MSDTLVTGEWKVQLENSRIALELAQDQQSQAQQRYDELTLFTPEQAQSFPLTGPDSYAEQVKAAERALQTSNNVLDRYQTQFDQALIQYDLSQEGIPGTQTVTRPVNEDVLPEGGEVASNFKTQQDIQRQIENQETVSQGTLEFGPGANIIIDDVSNESSQSVKTVRVSDYEIQQRLKTKDWRVRISLSPESSYFYNDPSISVGDILYPLKRTNGVIFPYTPSIQLTHTAHYEPTDITHTNYKFFNYKNSSIELITITADFTAQDTQDANYVLAVIHFFKTVTKMFYGKDSNPIRGTPPPLCYLTGHGTYAFDNHPILINSFSMTYPTDVDYINAGSEAEIADILPVYNKPVVSRPSPVERLFNSLLRPGGKKPEPKFNAFGNISSSDQITRIPTKLQITLSVYPVVTRNTISNNFDLKSYASGELLKGSVNFSKNGGGIW